MSLSEIRDRWAATRIDEDGFPNRFDAYQAARDLLAVLDRVEALLAAPYEAGILPPSVTVSDVRAALYG